MNRELKNSMRIIVFLPIIFLITSCGYGSYDECMKEEIKEVLQVHRDRMDGIQQEMSERDDCAGTIQTIVDGLNMDELWEDLTNKEYRITAIEKSMGQQSSGRDAPRACRWVIRRKTRPLKTRCWHWRQL